MRLSKKGVIPRSMQDPLPFIMSGDATPGRGMTVLMFTLLIEPPFWTAYGVSPKQINLHYLSLCY